MSTNNYKLWVILSEEEKPIGLTYAKTSGGAFAQYEEKTGNTRVGLHATIVSFHKNYYSFINLM